MKFYETITYPDRFLISKCGTVKSVRTGIIRKPSVNHKGYLTVNFTDVTTGTQHQMYVHRLVAEVFSPNPYGKPLVNHKDGDKQNNHYSNLEWCTASENTQHAYDNGLINRPKGFHCSLSALTEYQVEYIRVNYKPRCKTYNRQFFADKFGVSITTIKRAIRHIKGLHRV